MVAIARSFGAARVAARSVQTGMPAARFISTKGTHRSSSIESYPTAIGIN